MILPPRTLSLSLGLIASVCAAPVPARVELQTGRAVAYSEEWREAGPAVPGTNTGGSITTVGRLTRTKGNLEEAFLPEHQTAFVMDLTEGLVSRGIIARSADSAAAAVTIRFLKTEYFPDDRDYFLDALVAVMWADKSLERLYHVTTRDTNGKARGLFPTVAGGRKFVSDTLRGAIAADLAAWFASPGTPPGDGLRVGQRFDPCSDEIVGFLRDAYGPHSKREARVEVRVNRRATPRPAWNSAGARAATRNRPSAWWTSTPTAPARGWSFRNTT